MAQQTTTMIGGALSLGDFNRSGGGDQLTSRRGLSLGQWLEMTHASVGVSSRSGATASSK